MKTLLVVIGAGSLALNLLLVGVLFAGRSHVESAAATVPAPAKTPAVAAAVPVADAETWRSLQTDDLPAMVQRLREAGFPPEMIRAILAAQLRESFAAREKALDPDADRRPYWKNYPLDPRLQSARTQLYREQQKQLRALLGSAADPNETVMALYQNRRLDSVPAEKLDDVREVLRNAEEARQDAFSTLAGGYGMMSADMGQRLAALEKDTQAALARVLTPQELEQFNLRNSDTARQLRSTLSAFNPTEEEFRTLYKLQADFDERYGRYSSPSSPEADRQRMEAQRQLKEQAKAALGAVRAEEYDRATDFSYRQTSQLVARLELPPETTTQVWTVKKDIEDRALSLRRDSSVPPEERMKQLAGLADEAQAKLAPLLGARGFEAYKQYGGYWITSLTPRPAPKR